MSDTTALAERLRIAETRASSDQLKDTVFRWLMAAAGFFVLFSLLGVMAVMFNGGQAAFAKEGWHFITVDFWDPANNIFHGLAPIVGTIVCSLIALIIAVPLSLGIAVFLTELSPNFIRGPVSAAIEILASIPSIIYGMWGLFVLVPMLGEHVYPWINDNLGQLPLIGRYFQGVPIGVGLLTAGIVLAIMITPFISSLMREVFLTVPKRLKESAYALGSTTWEVVWDVVLPYTKAGVVGAIFMGLGRALGETMAVTFVIGNANRLATLLDPSSSISATIANEFGEAFDPAHTAALLGLGFLLFIVSFFVLSIAKLLLMSLKRREGK